MAPIPKAALHYKRGRAREYQIMKNYQRLGYIVLRSAGSHGFADIIAIHKIKKEIVFVQSKRGYLSPNAKRFLINENKWANDEFLCRYVLDNKY